VDRQNVVVVHNYYQRPGGEDQVVSAEVALLQSFGHDTQLFTLENSAIAHMGLLRLTRATFWNNDVYDTLRALFRKHAPLVAHFHNTFPLTSPAAYYAARAEGVPVVQTLHNFRLMCPNGLLFRDGHACEECVGRSVAWPGVVHGCYRGSRSTTAVTAAMIAWHRSRGTWDRAVDMYIALTKFARGRFTEGGLPEDRIAVKPNFLVHDPGVGDHAGGYGLFVGRLTPEKGLDVLLDAWPRLASPYPLKVVGSGPLDTRMQDCGPGIEWLGQQPTERVMALMKDASFLVVPSEYYEGFPVAIVEAFATGLPVIASRIGSLAEIVSEHQTGLLFRAGDAADLAATIGWAVQHAAEMRGYGQKARLESEQKFRPEQNYSQLRAIYDLAVEHAAAAVA
jgi:glycosyltransferase involved in cell wall biosynthesis